MIFMVYFVGFENKTFWFVERLSTFLCLGLSQDHKEPNGYGHHQEKTGERLLLECERVYAGLQHNVHKLLYLQQGMS